MFVYVQIGTLCCVSRAAQLRPITLSMLRMQICQVAGAQPVHWGLCCYCYPTAWQHIVSACMHT